MAKEKKFITCVSMWMSGLLLAERTFSAKP